MPGIEYKSEKCKYNKGQVVILQGKIIKELFFLNEGTIEVKRCDENIKGYIEQEIIEKSKRIEVITAPSIFGVENLINPADQKNSCIAMSDCEVTRFIIPNNDYLGFFKSAPQIAMNVLLTMKETVVKNISTLKKFSMMQGEIDKLTDNLSIFSAIIDRSETDPLLEKYKSNGGIIPSRIDGNFLIADYSTILNKVYGDPGYDPKAKFEWKKIEFYHFLIKSRPDSFIQIISAQMQVFLYIFTELSNILNMLSVEMGKMASKVDEKLDEFFYSEFSIFNRIVNNIDKIVDSEYAAPNISKSFIAIARNIDHVYKQLSGKEHTDIFPKLDMMIGRSNKNGTAAQAVNKPEKYRPMLKDSKKIIVNYVDLPGADRDKILQNISKVKDINFKDPTDKDSRKIIKEITADYFKMLSIIISKNIDDFQSMPIPVKLFLYFGFIDEMLISEDECEALFNSVKLFENLKNLDYPIITLAEYLSLIYRGEENPGLSLNGEEFNKLLRKSYGKEVEDTPLGRVNFEIDNMLKEGMRITSDNPRAYIPYLTSYSFKGAVSAVMNTPKKLEAFIKKINDVDHGLFFRELTWKITGHSELIMKEVKPYMILVPNSGIRVQLWQEIVNNSRSSRARFIVPTIFNGALEKSLVHSFANFRWELNKMIAGASWMDPVEGGFVGAFYDFSQYYNKMSELSLDAKEEIKSLFNKIKIDRDRFAYYYDKWVTYEKDGVAKINKAVRQIFYRHLPFPSYIRDKLKFLPLYEDLETRFTNVRKRDLKSLEARYHKYQQPDGTLPDDLQAYMDMLRK